MDYLKVLADLREYLARLDAAIGALERLQDTNRVRGRPTAWFRDSKCDARTRKARAKPRSQIGRQLPGISESDQSGSSGMIKECNCQIEFKGASRSGRPPWSSPN